FCVALKHMNPCGAAVAETIEEAWQKAYEADTVSIYGGIVICNRTITKEIALGMKPIFLEIVIAPDFTDEAMEIFATKKNLRVIQVDMTPSTEAIDQYVSVNGGLLVQHLDTQIETITADMCATKEQPDAATLADMQFGWNIIKHVKSNAIVVVKNGQTLGVGAGQMNRVGSAEIAMKQAHAAGVTEGLILASDGFLPFDDTVALAAKYGVTAIVQPGGSIRDNDCIVKADELGICMLMTGTRHFKH
ncbi:MAG: bifunctional phosphoribosylaminoimidazolecarboxamide formyltransferase/IMP cyclohydrolase, partial [Paludibacteraceae bacterium]|nr:bifunctional phosphoribosylaminoimidazolecarboxamide formyltransferase/IMP cyclohydrolase [Paludibacteraceae bacterium]